MCVRGAHCVVSAADAVIGRLAAAAPAGATLFLASGGGASDVTREQRQLLSVNVASVGSVSPGAPWMPGGVGLSNPQVKFVYYSIPAMMGLIVIVLFLGFAVVGSVSLMATDTPVTFPDASKDRNLRTADG